MRRGIWVAVALVTAFVVVVPLGVQAWGRLIRQTATEDRAFSRPVTAVEIDSPGGGVRVAPGPAGQIKVHSRLRWARNRPRVQPVWTGTSLRIVVGCDREPLFSGLECGVDLDVQVPADIALTAEVTSGEIDARGLSGATHLRTTSGAIRLTGVRGDVWARADSGEISGTALGSAQVDARLTSGVVKLGFATAPRRVSVVATSGPVKIGVPGGQYRVIDNSRSGPRKIDGVLVNGASDRTISVTTWSGPIKIGYPPPS